MEKEAIIDNNDKGEAGKETSHRATSIVSTLGQVINVSGHPDQLQRQYGLLSVCGLALTVDNAWVAIGTSLTVAVNNGGPAGVIYAFVIAVFYYCFIAASIAEVRLLSYLSNAINSLLP